LSPKLLTSSREPDVPPIVFGEWKVRNAKRTIVLYAHYDGQPVNPADWATDPFTPTLRTAPLEKGGTVIAAGAPSAPGASGVAAVSAGTAAAATDPETRLYARGSGDDKLGVMVILAAVDALRAFGAAPIARKGMVQAIRKQESPMVQIALIDQLTELKDREAVPVLQGLAKDSTVNEDVRRRAQSALGKLLQ